MFKDGQAIIVQIWMLNCEKNCQTILSVIREYPNLGDRVRIRCGRRILFSADNSFPPHRNASQTHRIDSDAFASCHLKYIIKNVRNATRRVAPHKCEPALTATSPAYSRAVLQQFAGSPQKSMRQCVRETRMNLSSVQRILNTATSQYCYT